MVQMCFVLCWVCACVSVPLCLCLCGVCVCVVCRVSCGLCAVLLVLCCALICCMLFVYLFVCLCVWLVGGLVDWVGWWIGLVGWVRGRGGGLGARAAGGCVEASGIYSTTRDQPQACKKWIHPEVSPSFATIRLIGRWSNKATFELGKRAYLSKLHACDPQCFI